LQPNIAGIKQPTGFGKVSLELSNEVEIRTSNLEILELEPDSQQNLVLIHGVLISELLWHCCNHQPGFSF
jgi:hypothetical protein